MMLNVYHINSYYIGNPLHKNLVDELSNKLSQSIFIPLQSIYYDKYKNINLPINIIKTFYEPIWCKTDRIFYKRKIRKAVARFNDLDSHRFDLLHAHTWFSDGGIAYELNKNNKSPFIITIRNTDINLFYKYRIDLRNYGHKVKLF